MRGYLFRRAARRALPYLWPVAGAMFILLTEPPAYALFLLAATALHETGHLFAFLACGEPLPRFTGRRFGLLLTPQGEPLSPGRTLLICGAGPLFNLLACLALLPALRGGNAGGAGFCFFALHLYTALFNLLPLSGFDGGRMLAALFTLFFPPEVGRRAYTAVAVAGALFFYFFALFLSFAAGARPYPFLLALFLLWQEAKSGGLFLEDERAFARK